MDLYGSVDHKALSQFLSELTEPFIPLNNALQALAAASVIGRLVHSEQCGGSPTICLKVQVGFNSALIELAPAGMAYLHHWGWSLSGFDRDYEPVIECEGLIDAVVQVLNLPLLGPRAYCTSEWTVRARASAAIAALNA